MPTLSLIGPGAIGCALLGILSQKHSYKLQAVARTPFDTLKVETTDGQIEAAVETLTHPEEVTEEADWIFICVKTYDFESILPWIDPLAGPQTKVAIIQNGIEHLDRIPSDREWGEVVPVIIDCPVERLAPGHARIRGDALMTVPDGDPGHAFRELFKETPAEVIVTDDWKTAAWKKLCLNAVGAVNAVLDLPVGIIHLARVEKLVRAVAEEAVAVGNADGAHLDSALIDSIVEKCQNAPRDSVNSMHADRAAGRPMELDARNGVIVRLGKEYHIPTPCNQTLVTLLDTLGREKEWSEAAK